MPEQVSTFLPLVGIALLFWLLIVRPASQRNKAMVRLRESVQPGDRIMLTSGIYGVLSAKDGDRWRVRIADGVEIECAPGALASVESSAQEG